MKQFYKIETFNRHIEGDLVLPILLKYSQFSKFLFLLFLFNILWIVANLIQIHTLELKGSQNLIQFWIRHMNVQRYLMAIRTYFTRWLIVRPHSYDFVRFCTILYDFVWFCTICLNPGDGYV